MVNIGKIGKTHGYDGTVRIIPAGNHPERFKNMKKVTVNWAGGRKQQEMDIERVRVSGEQVFMKFKDISSKEDMQAYQGGILLVPEEEVWPLPEGHYYYFQLEGLTVIDEEKGVMGILREVLETGANDVYVVERENQKDLLLPAIPQVVKKIDLQEKTMHIRLLKGLEDI